jgi:TPR repeat protein
VSSSLSSKSKTAKFKSIHGNRSATGSGKLVERARGLARGKQRQANLSESFRLLQRAAKSGNAEAEYAIGTWYLFGKYLAKSSEKAARHFAKAARGGHAPAMFDLAIMYETGSGVKQNKSRAFELYVRAALRGDVDSIKSVARCVFHGIGPIRHQKLGHLITDYSELVYRQTRQRSPVTKR